VAIIEEHGELDMQDFAGMIIRSARGPIRINQPGTIVSYDAEKQVATVQPALKILVLDRDAGTEEWKTPRPVKNVPIVFPSGGEHIVTWPLAAGDPVTLLFCDRDMGTWRNSGGTVNQPQSKSRFSPQDLFAIPGGRSPAAPMPAGSTDESSRVVWAAKTLFRFANVATKALAIAEGVRDRLNALESTFNGHTHLAAGMEVVSGMTVIGTTGPTATTAPSGTAGTTTLADLATTRIEVDE
jgi:hypothetical protein